jgi:hypothetical protein
MTEKSKWEQYKEKLGETRPWDILNPNTQYANSEVAEGRLKICSMCPKLKKVTKQCTECGCFMVVKTKMALASCPMGKW